MPDSTPKENIIPSTAFGKITDDQFKFLTEYLSKKYGLKIPPEKRVMVESRLISRVNKLKLGSINEYFEYTFKSVNRAEEYQFFVDQLTTHKTFFFRENYQFEFLTKKIKEYVDHHANNRPITVWSAGCSTGEEVYTLAMVLQEKKIEMPLLDYKIVGTDVSIPSLKKAAQGIFSHDLDSLPSNYKKTYFKESVNSYGKTTIAFNNTEVKNRIQLGILNLNNKTYNLPHQFDFIFCRNVTIYFDPQTRGEVMERIVSKLRPGGFLFLGHSETALGLTLPIKSIQPTIYQRL